MKTVQEIQNQLEQIYKHRFLLRLERKTKRNCRNCKRGFCKQFDLGQFGEVTQWKCKDQKQCNENCGFQCKNTPQEIQKQMIKDISDPSICGAKQPKIAILLWVLHGTKKESKKIVCDNNNKKKGFFEKIKGLLS